MSRTVRFPTGISDEALAAALATLGLALSAQTEDGTYNALPTGETAVINRCVTPGCARATVIRIGKYAYCATHGRRAMEERT